MKNLNLILGLGGIGLAAWAIFRGNKEAAPYNYGWVQELDYLPEYQKIAENIYFAPYSFLTEEEQREIRKLHERLINQDFGRLAQEKKQQINEMARQIYGSDYVELSRELQRDVIIEHHISYG